MLTRRRCSSKFGEPRVPLRVIGILGTNEVAWLRGTNEANHVVALWSFFFRLGDVILKL